MVNWKDYPVIEISDDENDSNKDGNNNSNNNSNNNIIPDPIYTIPSTILDNNVNNERRKRTKRQKKNKRMADVRNMRRETKFIKQTTKLFELFESHPEEFKEPNEYSMRFIEYCIGRSYFIESNFDPRNSCSLLLTKLTETFFNIDEKFKIRKNHFINHFQHKEFPDAEKVFEIMDTDKNGIINFADFASIFLRYTIKKYRDANNTD